LVDVSNVETGDRVSTPHLTYTGIGSRETPRKVLELMESIAARMARAGWVLRTGMSPGADQAFYRAERAAGGRVELYLPWPEFEEGARDDEDEGVRVWEKPSNQAYELAALYHPGWEEQSDEAKALLARDGHQVLGGDLQSRAKLVVCWTADGDRDGSGPRSGGTGQALRIAHAVGVPVLNLARAEDVERAARLPTRA
jgi:hypothetical protein